MSLLATHEGTALELEPIPFQEEILDQRQENLTRRLNEARQSLTTLLTQPVVAGHRESIFAANDYARHMAEYLAFHIRCLMDGLDHTQYERNEYLPQPHDLPSAAFDVKEHMLTQSDTRKVFWRKKERDEEGPTKKHLETYRHAWDVRRGRFSEDDEVAEAA